MQIENFFVVTIPKQEFQCNFFLIFIFMDFHPTGINGKQKRSARIEPV